MTVYHDGQFWVGVFNHVEDWRLPACRVMLGAEPSNEQGQSLICKGCNGLRFTEAALCADAPKIAANPKRRQREAARELRQNGSFTKAQQAMSQEREMSAQQRKAGARERRETKKRERFELRQGNANGSTRANSADPHVSAHHEPRICSALRPLHGRRERPLPSQLSAQDRACRMEGAWTAVFAEAPIRAPVFQVTLWQRDCRVGGNEKSPTRFHRSGTLFLVAGTGFEPMTSGL
ncbi:YjdF family protein [Coriobacterium glomerans]|uniref:YjdF family protein n=1 Tax=Coriobacterium glomerans TaxID=33871 RepID=UPI003CCAA4CF